MNAKSVAKNDKNSATARVSVNSIRAGAAFSWLGAGWREFILAPSAAVLYGLLFANLAAVTLWSARNWPGLAIAFATGLMLISQFLAVGLYAGARQHEQGLPISIPNALRLLRQRAVNLGLLALILALIMLLWVRIAASVFADYYADFEPSIEAYIGLFSGEDGPLVTAYFMLIGFVLALTVFVTSNIAAPMIVDRNCNPLQAMRASVRAFAANPLPMLIWAALIVVLSALGIAPFFIGMWILFPILGYASWHSYRALIR